MAHNPGYPLYTLLTWPIAQVPIGELAWRINVFSAVMGAAATGLVFLAARRLAARPIVAAAAALGFAAGATFWSQAVIAEVYTLHAALVAGLLVAALTWSRSRRPAHFYAALGCLAAGLGHHTTILAFAPGLALQALIVDRHFVLRARTLVTSAAILALGLLPYALILVRSRDPEAYVESRATTLGELAQVVLGRQFQDRLLSDDWRGLASAQAPLLWERVFVGDLTWAGIAFAAIGAVWLLLRRPGDALLMASGGAAVTAFAIGYAVPDVPVFVIPALLCLWLFAAAGCEQALRLLARLLPEPAAGAARRGARPRGAGAPRLARVAARGPRRSQRRSAGRAEGGAAVRGAAAAIGDRVRRLHRRPHAAVRAARPRSAPRARDPDRAARRRGAAGAPRLGGAGRRLRAGGRSPPLRGPGLLGDAGGAPRRPRRRSRRPAAARRGGGARQYRPSTCPASRPTSNRRSAGWARAVAVGPPRFRARRRGRGLDAGTLAYGNDAGGARLTLPAGDGVWGHGRSELELVAEAGTAAIRLGGRDLVRTAAGVALAVWAPDGRLLRATALQAVDGFSSRYRRAPSRPIR